MSTFPDFNLDRDVPKALGQTFSPTHSQVETLNNNVVSNPNNPELNLTEVISPIETAKHELENKLHTTVSLLAPIRRAPPEIMSQIFCYASYIKCVSVLTLYSPVNIMSPDTTPLALFGVCRLWRQIALDTPYLFTQIFLQRGTPLGRVIRWLNHSKRLPLEVYIGSDGYFRGRAQRFAEIMRPHLHRIRVLINLHIQYLFPPETLEYLPSLKNLELSRSSRNFPIGTISVPVIQHLNIGSGIRWEDRLIFGDQLSTFSANVSGSQSLSDLLPRFPNLRSCRVVSKEEPGDSHFQGMPLHSITLPRLEVLWIEWRDDAPRRAPNILEQLHTPKLSYLHIDGSWERVARTRMSPSITRLLRRSQAPLRKLHLDYGHGELLPEDIRSLLETVPNLERLWVSSTNWTDFTFTLLNRDVYPDICPSLVTLTLHGVVLPLESILGVFRSRVRRPSPLDDKFKVLMYFGTRCASWRGSDDDPDPLSSARGAISKLEDELPEFDIEMTGDSLEIRRH